MYIADTLSRLNHNQESQGVSQAGFEKDIERICNLDNEASNLMPGGELQEVKKFRAENETLKMVSQFMKHGGQMRKEKYNL